jgi:acyl-coenzyme A thioesterase PaaI-like protein
MSVGAALGQIHARFSACAQRTTIAAPSSCCRFATTDRQPPASRMLHGGVVGRSELVAIASCFAKEPSAPKPINFSIDHLRSVGRSKRAAARCVKHGRRIANVR